ncbi:MAG: sugar transferase, partial [Candidatus Andersenbacteria bacterium]
MKRSELLFDAMLLPLDFLAIAAAGAVAYYLRLSPTVQRYRPAVFELDLPFLDYMQLVSIVAIAIIGIFALQGLYAMQVTRRMLDELTSIFAGISIGVMLVIVYIFLSAELFQSRFILLAAYVMALVFVTTTRIAIRKLQVAALRRGFGIHRVALVGNGRLSEELIKIFKMKPQLGYRVVGVPDLVRWDVLENIYQRTGIDEVIQTDPSMPEEDNLILLDFCDQYKIDYKYIPNLFETYAAHVRFRQLGGVPVMELLRTPLDGWGRIAKRIMDIVGALLGLIILSPLLLATAMAIKLDSPGSILYRQIRMGKNTRPFHIYKFRSMKQEYCRGEKYGGESAEQLQRQLREQTNERKGPLFKMRNDPRITRVGRFIRRWRIDELPQLLNVLRSEMSLLGPRPHLPEEVQRYDKYHRKLFTIKPGMSGMAQVNGNAGLPFDQEAKLDIGYIENWSLWHDIILLVKTFIILL